MGALRHAEFCICPDCVENPKAIYCDDTPKVINEIKCTPEYVYLDYEGKAWVCYSNSIGLENEISLLSWENAPDFTQLSFFNEENNDVS